MGIRCVFLAAAAICLIPAVASAQAVPPRDFVGPPVELAGSNPTVPAPRNFVGPPAPESPKVDAHGIASSIGTGGAVAGAVVDGVGFGTDINIKMLKTAKQYSDGAGLVTPYAETGVDYAKTIKAAKEAKGKVRVVGNAVAVVELAADVTAAWISCSSGDTGNCIMDSLDVAGDLAAQGGPWLKAGSTMYTGGKLFGSAITSKYEKEAGQALAADWYDWVLHPGETAKILNDATTPEAFEAARQKHRAAYRQSQGALMSTQADYDAQQARIEAERQAAAQQAAQQAASAYQTQNFLNNFNLAFQPQLNRALAPASQRPDVCAEYFNGCHFCSPFIPQLSCGAASPQPAISQPRPTAPASSPPTSSGGGCGGNGPGTCR